MWTPWLGLSVHTTCSFASPGSVLIWFVLHSVEDGNRGENPSLGTIGLSPFAVVPVLRATLVTENTHGLLFLFPDP